MPAHYDAFDYPSYWKGREYEHKSEILALSSFLNKIPQIKTVLEIGGGFGRLISSYAYRAKKVILSDPSAKNLKIAKTKADLYPNVSYVQSSLENLPAKLSPHSADVVIMVRVIHHLYNPDFAFKIISKLLKKHGFLILEFANKEHFKARISNLIKGNLAYNKDTAPVDVRSPKSIKQDTLPFFNYHPFNIEKMLLENGFYIVDKRSVSNLRNTFMKRVFGTDFLISLEKLLQKPLSFVDFGPSVFILARKRG